MNYASRIFKFFILFTVSTLFINCETEQLESSPETITIQSQNISRLRTIPIKQTIEYIKNIENNNLYARELELDVDLESIRQEEITNTDAEINLIDATTQFENIESVIMQIEIDGTTQTILYNVIPEDGSNTESDSFSGNVVITDLSGMVFSNFYYNSGELIGEVNLNNYYSSDTDPCWGIACGIDLEEVVINATLTIYALEPNPGSGDTSVVTIAGASVGHTFISITQGNSTSVYGYYPVSNWINPWNTSGSSVLGNDSNNLFSASITTTISGGQLQLIINASINFNTTYNLNTYNCTDFAIEMGNLGGLNLPPSNGTWTNGGNGSNPGTLGMEIRNRNQQQGQTINTNGGNSPATDKGC